MREEQGRRQNFGYGGANYIYIVYAHEKFSYRKSRPLINVLELGGGERKSRAREVGECVKEGKR